MNAFDSLRRTFRDLNVSQRATLASAMVVVLLAGAAFVRWASAPSFTVLYSDVDSSQLSEVVDSLEAQNVDYRLEGGGSRILVPQS